MPHDADPGIAPAADRAEGHDHAFDPLPPGTVAVIFTSRRSTADPDGYAAATAAMDARAKRQPGYLGMASARGEDGFGITVSYWASEADALAWRADADHSRVRLLGRERWYDEYRVIVAGTTRSYRWRRPAVER